MKTMADHQPAKPHAAKNLLKTLRRVIQVAIAAGVDSSRFWKFLFLVLHQAIDGSGADA
jgi:hypothetical protein